MFQKKVLLAIAFSWVAVPLLAQSDVRDSDLVREVLEQVTRYVSYTVFDSVDVEVDGGIVTLTGYVTMPFKSSAIEERVASVQGVRAVRNRIRVLPVSGFDNALRHRIARELYGTSAFWNYAAMQNPPIHIVVDRGRVLLTGVVNSNVDRMLAGTIATSSGALAVENRLKTEQEVRMQLERVP